MHQTLRDKTRRYTVLQLWLAGGLIAFALGFYLFVYRPVDHRSHVLSVLIEKERQELEISRQRASDLPRIAQENEELTLRVARSKRLPRLGEWAEFVREITHLSNQASLKKFSYKYGTARREALYAQLPIELEFEGEMPDVTRFLQNIEELPRLVRLRGINIKNRADRPGYVQVQMALNTYFSTEP